MKTVPSGSGTPYVGRAPKVADIVHYQSFGTPNGEYPSVCRAAIVADVDRYQPSTVDKPEFVGHVALAVLNPEGMFFNRAVLFDDGSTRTDGEPKGGTWHWAEHD